jgi:hypothetical protein
MVSLGERIGIKTVQRRRWNRVIEGKMRIGG